MTMPAPFPSPTKTWHTDTYPTLSSTRPELSAKGKTVVVTGGGTGIGAETARHFAQAGAARIALFGRREQPLLDTKAAIEKAYPDVVVITAKMDTTQRDQVDAAFALVKAGGDQGGEINVLVSGAAMTGAMDSVRDVDPEKFMYAIDQNLRGSLHVAQAFLRHAAKDATVVEINSSGAHVNFGPGFAAYGVAKLGVFRLWDSLAFAHPDMSVFHIQPGVVDTAMNKEAGGVEAVGFEDKVALPASFILWLSSPEAKFLKGKFLWSNWDVDELMADAKAIEASEKFNIGLVGWPFGGDAWKFEAAEGAASDSAFRAK